MAEYRELEINRRLMAHITGLRCRNVRRRFAERQSTVVASAASASNFFVVHFPFSNRPTGSGHVTGLALVRRIDVTRGFSGGIGPVVARQTIAGIHAGVIELRWGPFSLKVAYIAFFGGNQMLHWLAGRDSAVVATGANAQNLAVVDGFAPLKAG